jgi:hypothetical protein
MASEDECAVVVEDAERVEELYEALEAQAPGASAIRLVAEGCAVGPACTFGGVATARLVALDLSSAGLESFALASAHARLLELELSGNRLAGVPCVGAHAPCLRRLDLSFNVGVDVLAAGAWVGYESLRELLLEGCALTALAPSGAHLAPLQQLVEIVVADNDALDDLEAFACLRALPALASVDATDCPVADARGFRGALAALCGPALRTINKAHLPRAGASTKPWDQVEGAAARAERAQRLAEELSADGRLREGCSCVYGNACADEYTCLVWAKRFEVAAAVKAGTLDARKLMRAASGGGEAVERELKAAGLLPS